MCVKFIYTCVLLIDRHTYAEIPLKVPSTTPLGFAPIAGVEDRHTSAAEG